MLNVAVQMDPIETVNIDGDSTFALMLEAQRRGHKMWHYDVRHMSLHEGKLEGKGRVGRLLARAQPVTVQRVAGAHYSFGTPETLDLGTMDTVLMRQDPPFDMAYITATHMLEHIHPRTLVVNDPKHVRDAPEKLLVTHFPELMPPTLITWDTQAIRAFRREYRDIIVKPLFGNGGAGVFRIREDDENLASLLEMHFARSREPLMIQRYEAAVRKGDKRVILVDGVPLGAINRVPAAGEARSNMHVGGRPEKTVLTEREREICAAIGPHLRDHGLIFVGIDVIGDYLTEINVTSPTGLQELARFDGTDLSVAIWDSIEAKVAAGRGLNPAAAAWRAAGLPEAALGRLHLPGQEPVLPSSFKVATAAQAAIGLAGLAAAEFWRLRGGTAQDVTVDLRHAAAEARSERLLRVDGVASPDPWDDIAGLYSTASGGWVRLHTNFPHHRAGILRLLGCGGSRAEVARALAGWDARAFEAAAADTGMCAAAARSLAEWDATPQAQALAKLDLVQITRIGPAPPRRWAPTPRPLDGVRVLDLTRVIAGPVCGRTLAAHGGEVLAINGPHLPSIPTLVIDTGRGKRSASLDLRAEAGGAALAGLLGGATLFVQGYRPGALAALGFGPQDAARLRPGIVCVSLSAYGGAGDWAGRRGFDSLVQTATGLNLAEAESFGEATPRALPAQVLDHATGHLMAFGAIAALMRQAQEGGSWLVELSLARTALWLRGLGRMQPASAELDDVAFLEESPSGFGRLTAVRHAAQMGLTPVGWARPAVPLGTHPAEWG